MSLVKPGPSTQDSVDSMGRWGVPFSAAGVKRTVRARGDQGGEEGWTTGPQSHLSYLQPCKVHFSVPYIEIQNGVLTTTGSILLWE